MTARVPRRTILVGDALTQLKRLPGGCVDTVVTSPPYFLLRSYQGGEREIGTESTVEAYVQRLVTVMVEVARVLKPTGSCWLNLGDSFSRGPRYGAPAKGMLLAPERVVLALTATGMFAVRSKVVWVKSNPMPNSVKDRVTCCWEYLFHLVIDPHRYWFDLDAIREPHRSRPGKPSLSSAPKYNGRRPDWAGPLAGSNSGLLRAKAEGRVGHPAGRNPRDAWIVPTAGFRGAHFATFPERLVERPIKASCPPLTCRACGSPWPEACGCRSGTQPGLVLDPFIGAGTVGVVAERLGRDWLGFELNPQYGELALERIARAREEVINKEQERSAA